MSARSIIQDYIYDIFPNAESLQTLSHPLSTFPSQSHPTVRQASTYPVIQLPDRFPDAGPQTTYAKDQTTCKADNTTAESLNKLAKRTRIHRENWPALQLQPSPTAGLPQLLIQRFARAAYSIVAKSGHPQTTLNDPLNGLESVPRTGINKSQYSLHNDSRTAIPLEVD